ncbi:MAG: putative bifunctional diguanylate cyclase/phosphodiesterase, partial [Rhodoferax sp.]
AQRILRVQESALEQINRELDQRVQERTQELQTAMEERQLAEQRLNRIARQDPLTNLPNRVLLADRMRQAMALSLRRGLHLGIAYLDLDGFKDINDRYGQEIGDRVLITLAGRIHQLLRDGDTLARVGGDEFGIVLMELTDPKAAIPILSRLLEDLASPITIDALQLKVTASLGVTFFPQPETIDADQMLRQADQAMYQAKLAGKNRHHVFDADQDRSARGHHESLERMRLALGRGEFVLHYQPKVNMRTGSVIGAEALIRWQHPEKGLLMPASFLPVIEEHSLAVEVGEWVINTALAQMQEWQQQGLQLGVSVNVGARQLQQPDFAGRLKSIIGQHPAVDPKRLELEVLETSALEDVGQISSLIDACSAMGVCFALDDFGTGYSSLTYLKRLPVAVLKIDQSFVRGALDDARDLAILQGVIGLAAAFGREVIAEGVETIAHGAKLLQIGCDFAQGYGIARPMPASAMAQWAAAWKPDLSWQC